MTYRIKLNSIEVSEHKTYLRDKLRKYLVSNPLVTKNTKTSEQILPTVSFEFQYDKRTFSLSLILVQKIENLTEVQSVMEYLMKNNEGYNFMAVPQMARNNLVWAYFATPITTIKKTT